MVEASKVWDRIYSGLHEAIAGEDAWLQRWRHDLEASRGSPVLDLGCGAGHDARFLTGLGLTVVAADFSEEALGITRRRAPAAKTENVDLTRGLPFPDAHFGVIIASLSLHYFPWHQTTSILDDVRRCLEPGGHLLARFNSTRDPHYSAAEKRRIENNFYEVEGIDTATKKYYGKSPPKSPYLTSEGVSPSVLTRRRSGVLKAKPEGRSVLKAQAKPQRAKRQVGRVRPGGARRSGWGYSSGARSRSRLPRGR